MPSYSSVKGVVVYAWSNAIEFGHIRRENFDREFCANYTITGQEFNRKIDVATGTGDPEKRSSGSDAVLQIATNNTDAYTSHHRLPFAHQEPAWAQDVVVPLGASELKLYVQSDAQLTTDEIQLKARYLKKKESTSRYSMAEFVSSETIATRANAADWSQYLTVNVDVPEASVVHLELHCRKQSTSSSVYPKIYIDPLVV